MRHKIFIMTSSVIVLLEMYRSHFFLKLSYLLSKLKMIRLGATCVVKYFDIRWLDPKTEGTPLLASPPARAQTCLTGPPSVQSVALRIVK